MTVEERILKAIANADCEVDSIDKIISLAYYMGRESAAKEVCDKAHDIFKQQRQAANNCRYHNLAREMQGNITHLYHPDYSGTMMDEFGNDITVY